MAAWAIDLGTSNTAVCRWNDALQRPELVALRAVCRLPDGDDPLQAPRLVPSATHVVDPEDVWSRLGRRPFFRSRFFWGRQAWIGRQAIERNLSAHHPGYVPSFKRWLGRASSAPLARTPERSWMAREVAEAFVRELLAEVHRTTGERITELVLTAPVESFESYRAELAAICRRQGVRSVRFVDEPVAAALGYGLGLSARRRVVVVDFGAGTLDLALVELTARDVELGRCEVIAKAGRPVGGDHVDSWLLDDLCARLGARIPADEDFWRAQMLDEARRVKEQSYVRGSDTFCLLPPDAIADAVRRVQGPVPELSVDQAMIREVLEGRGLFGVLEGCLDELLDQARHHGVGSDDVDEVLMVGGSTLLPGVYPLFEGRFGRDRVRAWRPFEAVAWGATALAAGAYTHTDFIVHDYAILTYDADSGEPAYLPVVRRGTRFPTRGDHWRRQLVPTCALGEPETLFKLVICELGTGMEDERLFGWDAEGQVHALTAGETRLVVPLNGTAPTLGTLDPPHAPTDRNARLDVAFGVNAERWLTATVRDLRTGRTLMDDEAVVRLL
ncbi:MAG: Hsp70 family protein [Alphaproteobacteria bacterium]|nr:Hsp70 family protein [Alphaproteobacteria bacterium]